MTDKIKILYVDDEEINTQLFAINFGDEFDIITGLSGEEGLELLKNNPDTQVTISDMKMPGMNGIEFIKEAKSKFDRIKYFILTGYDINEEIQEALNCKLIYKYFRKPFNMDVIKTAIQKALKEGC